MNNKKTAAKIVLLGPSEAELKRLLLEECEIHLVISERTALALGKEIDRFRSVCIINSYEGVMDSYHLNRDKIFSYIRKNLLQARSKNQDLILVSAREHTQRLGAWLRDALGINGESSEVIELFRNKHDLYLLLAETDLKVPRSIKVDKYFDADVLEEWASKGSSDRFIIKPLDQASSNGVHEVKKEELVEKVFTHVETWKSTIVQEFIDLPTGHIDGAIRKGKVSDIFVGRYWRTTLEYQRDMVPMGSIDVTEELGVQALNLVNTLISITGIKNSTFHVEVFIDNKNLIFLEAAARPGGVNIPDHLLAVYGYDIRRQHIFIQNELGTSEDPKPFGSESSRKRTGWIIFPNSAREISRVIKCGIKPGPWKILVEEKPEIGTTIDPKNSTGLDSVARYVVEFSSTNIKDALEQIDAIANSWEIELNPI